MKLTSFPYLFSGIAIILLLTFGCDKEDAYKNPTPVSFSITMNPDGLGPTDDLILEEGYIVLGNFTILGERSNAENFEFTREFPTGLNIPFMSSDIFQELQFDLPQGDYNKITVRFETFAGNGTNLFVLGSYSYNNPLKPSSIVHLEINNTKIFETDITDALGNNQINLNEFYAKNPLIILNPHHWFLDVSLSMLNNALFNLVNGEQVITIDNNSNSNIFSVVDSMVGEDIKCVL